MGIPVRLKGKTEAELIAENPVLLDRQICFATDAFNFKVGPGAWNSLSYWLTSGSPVFLGRFYEVDIPTTGTIGQYLINRDTSTYWQWNVDNSQFEDTGDPVQDFGVDVYPTLGSNNLALSGGIAEIFDQKAPTVHSHNISDVSGLDDQLALKLTITDFLTQLVANTQGGPGISLSIVAGKLRITNSGDGGTGSGDFVDIGGLPLDNLALAAEFAKYQKTPVWTTVTPVDGVVTLPAVNGSQDYYEYTESGAVSLAHSGTFKDAGYKWIRVTMGSAEHVITLGAGYVNDEGDAQTEIILNGPAGKVRNFHFVRDGSTWIVYEDAEREEIENHYKGTYTSLANLQAAHPTAEPGDEAIVDEGVGTDAVKYIWDDTDGEWVPGGGVGASSFSDLAGVPTDNAALAAALTAAKDRANHTGTQLAATISDFADTVRATVLTGLSTAVSAAITATDTILSALGKLQAQIGNKVNKAGDTMTGNLVNSGYFQSDDGDEEFGYYARVSPGSFTMVDRGTPDNMSFSGVSMNIRIGATASTSYSILRRDRIEYFDGTRAASFAIRVPVTSIANSTNKQATFLAQTGNVMVASVTNYADDAAAAAGGVPVGGAYNSSGTLKIRLV